MNIFELLSDKYVLPSKPKLFEAFSGIGCQLMAFKRLGIDVESVGFSEIDKYAIQSYKAIHGDIKNWGSICDIKGEELPQIDVFTWSFPCTDLSKAGKQKGLTNTRSGLVYEVLRIMQECKINGNLPKALIMENVVDLVQVKFIREFQEIQLELEHLGYSNYTQVLNAKDYGVAQNRERVFMVSILGDYYYEFPQPIKLEKRLKDYLESEVDSKYYLSEQFIKCMTQENTGSIDRKAQFMRSFEQQVDERIASCITTRETNVATSNFILMPEDTKQGYAKDYDGDGVYTNRPHQKRGVVQSGMIQTLKTSCSDIGVVVEDIVIGSGQKNAFQGSVEGVCSTLTSAMGMGGGQTPMVTENNRLKIRKLTPLECWRLMGIDDDDFYKAQSVVSNSQLYKCAGNGLVVDVFALIISTMAKL